MAALLTAVVAIPAAAAGKPTPAQALARLRPEHPRLLATADDFAALKALVAHPKVAPAFAAVRAAADAALTAPTARYELRDGVRLLYVSREVRDRALALGLMYRLTGDRRYADRLGAEADAVAGFPDWNPKHFLDTAEMSMAMAVAYDWAGDAWPPARRAAVRAAIVRLGLTPALDAYRQPENKFPLRANNWNQVCNGGALAAALAVAEDEPAAAGEAVAAAVASLPLAMARFAPDGASAEGPGYWGYATEYNCLALGALRTALGTDFGLAALPGFAATGDDRLAGVGPVGLTFNYADGPAQVGPAPQLYWLATAFDAPAYAAFQNRSARVAPGPLDLLWGARWLAADPPAAGRPLARHFRGPETVYLRGAWDDPQAAYVGFKGGDNKASHAHLDLGSFVFDALGQRWAMDPGPDDYNRPGYFGALRWTYYRCRAEGHNGFVLAPGADPDQSPTAVAPVVRFAADARRAGVTWAGAVVDLTAAYPGKAAAARRGVALLGRKRLLVQDEVRAATASAATTGPATSAGPVPYLWFMHTEAEVTVSADGRTATLVRGGRTLTARLLSPPGARFTIRPTDLLPTSPPEPPPATRPVVGAPGKLVGVRKLTVATEVGAAAGPDLRVAMLLDPGDGSAPPPEVVPLDAWPGDAPAQW